MPPPAAAACGHRWPAPSAQVTLPCPPLHAVGCCRLFPVGTRLAVKEPYFKRYLDGTCGLRVDTPSDVVFLPPASSEPGASSCSGGGDATGGSSDPQELSRRGNELFG